MYNLLPILQFSNRPFIAFTLAGCPLPICSACPCGVGAGRALFDLIGGFGEVKLDVMPVSAGAI